MLEYSSGFLALPRALMTFSVAGRPSGSFRTQAVATIGTIRTQPSCLRLFFRAPHCARDRPESLPASLGIRSLGCPAADMPEPRPLPRNIAASLRSAAAKQPTCSAPVVSHHLDGLLRDSGCEPCDSLPAGIRCVLCDDDPSPAEAVVGPCAALPAAHHPSKNTPRQ